MTLFFNVFKPWFQFRFRSLIFHMIRGFSKAYAFLNSKLIKLIKPKLQPLHKGMAETDVSHEFGREPGFFRSAFAVLDPASSHMLHMEVPPRLSAECSIIETHKIVKIVTKLSKLSKFVQITLNFKIRVYFWFMGLGQFSECGLVFCLL